MYYYNLACAHAELGNLDLVVRNLRLASERKHNMLDGGGLPNPREDDSFKAYLGRPEFESLLAEIGFPR